MSIIKKKSFWVILIVVLAAAGIGLGIMRPQQSTQEIVKEISPHTGTIQTLISSTGTVLPKNRLEIIPPVAGRIESIVVKEGEKVKKGQVLGWLSSTDRAALLDAAQEQGEEKYNYWQEVYKPIALMAPIDGEVIVATIQPGQTVTASSAVLVLSDQLIARAQVDETDIGKIKVGQQAVITLDAYPDSRIKAVVDHVYYESSTVNNVTIYKVDLIPLQVAPFFRSGMNATIDFIVESKDNALLLAQEAVNSDNGESYVVVRGPDAKEFVPRQVTLGLTQGKNVEILTGLSADDTVIVRSKKYTLPRADSLGKNPFLPSRRNPSSNVKKSGPGAGAPPP
ncbi:MAG TPA: efflux RND transporter periplasmic adaptor subunit [Candidatus Omnitrophota bacterium]|nr:efflux RND transporter periplasmic adaptor subunit [Candidatus Omnitrophota bacterium]